MIAPGSLDMMSGSLGFECIKCIPGKYLGEQTIDLTTKLMKSDLPTVCTDCSAGSKQEKEGTTFCLPCLTGTKSRIVFFIYFHKILHFSLTFLFFSL